MKFKYRDSLLKRKTPGLLVVTQVTIALYKKGSLDLTYLGIKRSNFKKNDNTIDSSLARKELASAREKILMARSLKGMLFMNGFIKFQSVGSFFKNPIVTKKRFENIKKIAMGLDSKKTRKLQPWNWPDQYENYKISAAFLMEFTPFHKGYRKGQVGISERHSLALINLGGARAQAVIALANEIQKAVWQKFGIKLESEVQPVGFMENPLDW